MFWKFYHFFPQYGFGLHAEISVLSVASSFVFSIQTSCCSCHLSSSDYTALSIHFRLYCSLPHIVTIISNPYLIVTIISCFINKYFNSLGFLIIHPNPCLGFIHSFINSWIHSFINCYVQKSILFFSIIVISHLCIFLAT